MTQSEFNKELKLGKRSWPGSHVEGDLDISDREIQGDINLQGISVDGDLDLSGTIIHGSLFLVDASVKGNLYLDNLRVKGEFSTARGALAAIEGEITFAGLTVNGRKREISPSVVNQRQMQY